MADKQTVEAELWKIARTLCNDFENPKIDSFQAQTNAVAKLNQLLIKERLDERKMAMVRTKNYTKDEIDLMIEAGMAYPADIERIAELENQLGEKP